MELLWPIIFDVCLFLGIGLLAISILTPLVVMIGGLLPGAVLAACHLYASNKALY
ncbi:hypothetical protein KSF_038660 [Reticulibacter mediterranei]|uniref:Uncharacterized protein n=1 Tax=Reticulibacter mediterranei TaxID=2778369 RepID=A0A8J3N2Z2_9CHLR|nr:hypothetical protein [Reticulibacter mediterranei]GHO93818.1 hypothetical protein KSF_038660 [Reticulibacter mediterranei]